MRRVTLLLAYALGAAVGLPLSIAVVNRSFGLPEPFVWLCETTRLDWWLFWLAGDIHETPWWF